MRVFDGFGKELTEEWFSMEHRIQELEKRLAEASKPLNLIQEPPNKKRRDKR